MSGTLLRTFEAAQCQPSKESSKRESIVSKFFHITYLR